MSYKSKKNYALTFLIIVSFIINSTVISYAASSNYQSDETDEPESHLIEGIPYAEKNKIFSCDYAPIEMVFRYYGVNITDIEIFYTVGGGYSQGYKIPLKRLFRLPVRKPPFSFICLGDLTVGGTEDYQFLAGINGLSFEYLYPKIDINKQRCWEKYWNEVKYYIARDIPIITVTNPYSWPPYREMKNITQPARVLTRSCCVEVIAGYNESNSTVCVLDQYVGYEKGYYRWVDIKSLKESVRMANWEMKQMSYSILMIQNSSNPLPNNTVHEKIHERNIKKMKGLKEAYDGDFVKNNFRLFGLNALKALKEDLNLKFIFRMPFYIITNKLTNFNKDDCGCSSSPTSSYPLEKMIEYFLKESKHKYCISQYLLENADLNSNYKEESILLEIESIYWKDLSDLVKEIQVTISDNSIHMSLIRTKEIIEDMAGVLDNIILIEEKIIED